MTRLNHATVFAALALGLSTSAARAEEPAAAVAAPTLVQPAAAEKTTDPAAMTVATGDR